MTIYLVIRPTGYAEMLVTKTNQCCAVSQQSEDFVFIYCIDLSQCSCHVFGPLKTPKFMLDDDMQEALV
jgi:hypothetical protein